ncbi:hypothetical protein L484_017092 [Morus notabilis]|uniref:HMG box domain-containing protein n=1 Tax=Morus notabilis TaxID=981085 RepID=W9S9N2_9ROSA|nr:hypothetical protein L484_017092 [Morus notabilis]
MSSMDFQQPRQSSSNTPPPPPRSPIVVPTNLASPTPLQLSGFLSGDTIQVQGDAGNLQFSVQLNINKTLFPEKVGPFQSLETVEYTREKFSTEDLLSPASSYVTPIASELLMDENCCTSDRTTEIRRESFVVTRLRSGVISPVTYYPRVSLSCCEKVVKSRKKKKVDVFERLFRRHSCPIRPCTSYAFFVMATWGDVKSSSFGETSKKLGLLWCKLPQKDKKLYEEMAVKDNARYKRQSKLFNSKAAQTTQRR